MVEAAVIITVYNKEKYLKDAIESVLRQNTMRSFCIVLSDDGSSDSSRMLCREYAEHYPAKSAEGASQSRFVADITDGVHRGLVGNSLYCMEYALSLGARYISQIDCDDILADRYFLERQISFLESNSMAQAAASSFFLISEEDSLATLDGHDAGTDTRSVQYHDLKTSYSRLLSENNTLAAGGVTYRAEHLSGYIGGFASEEDATQDLPLWLYLSLKGGFWGCAVPSLAYRNLPESASRSNDIERQCAFQESSLKTRLRFIEYLKLLPEYKAVDFKKLESLARRLYAVKVLRHYAKLRPKSYLGRLKAYLRKYPVLIFSKDVWRSFGVYLKNR